MSRTNALLRALAAFIGLVALVIAIPIALIVAVGWPLPHTIPALRDLQWRLRNGQIPDTFWIKLFACIVWTAWTQLAAAVAAELVAVLARRPTVGLPVGFGWAQATVGRLVATVAVIGAVAIHSPKFTLPLLDTTPSRAPVALTVQPRDHPTEEERTPAARTWTVARLDTLWGIAEQTLGDGERALEIRDLNAGRIMPDGTVLAADFLHVKAGWTVVLPNDAAMPAASPASVTTHTVVADENFWVIAEHALEHAWGRDAAPAEIAPYWQSLVEANRHRLAPPHDPNVIFPNQIFDIAQPPNPPEARDNAVPPPPVGTPSPTTTRPAPATINPTSTSAPTTARQTTTGPERTATRPVTTPSTRGASIAPTSPGGVTDTTLINDDESTRLPVIIGGCSLLAGAIVLTLRGLRHAQVRRRRARTQLPPLSEAAQRTETALRSIAQPDATAWLDATLRFLASHYRDNEAPPQLALVRAGTLGVELLLHRPSPPPRGFVCTDASSRSWTLDPSLELDQLCEEGAGSNPFAPALVPIGTTGGDELLIDLEALDVLRIDGDVETAEGVLRAMALAATTMPWTKHLEVVTIGIDQPPAATLSPDDALAWVNHACAQAERLHDQLDIAPFATRLRDGDVWYPTIVFVGADHDEVAAQLASAATLTRSALIVVAASEIDAPCRVCVQSPELALLEPFGIGFLPIGVERETAETIDELIEHAHIVSHAPAVTDEEAATDAASIDRHPSVDCLATIAAINVQRPVEVRLLTRSPIITGLQESAPAKLAAVIVYLAWHRQVPIDRIRGVFWPAASNGTFNNNMATVRKLLGVDEHGDPRLPGATNGSEYVVSEEVATDWHRAQRLIDAANQSNESNAIEYLTAALRHIEGWPLADAESGHYSWILDEVQIRSEIETTLLDAAERLGALALRYHDVELARFAAHQGNLVVPGQESLYRLRMRAEHQAGNSDGVAQAYREAIRAVEAIDDCDEVQPETRLLYQRIVSELRKPYRDTRPGS